MAGARAGDKGKGLRQLAVVDFELSVLSSQHGTGRGMILSADFTDFRRFATGNCLFQ